MIIIFWCYSSVWADLQPSRSFAFFLQFFIPTFFIYSTILTIHLDLVLDVFDSWIFFCVYLVFSFVTSSSHLNRCTFMKRIMFLPFLSWCSSLFHLIATRHCLWLLQKFFFRRSAVGLCRFENLYRFFRDRGYYGRIPVSWKRIQLSVVRWWILSLFFFFFNSAKITLNWKNLHIDLFCHYFTEIWKLIFSIKCNFWVNCAIKLTYKMSWHS